MAIKAIGFDYGGVIVGAGGNAYNQGIEKILGIDREQRREAYFKYNQLCNSGQISYEELWQKILANLGKMDKYDELIKFIYSPKNYEINRKILELADVLKTNGYKTGILSNNSKENGEKMKTTGILKHFDLAVISAEVGCSKPDPKIFEIFCQQLQVNINELIFIDDSPGNITAAEKLGCKAILYTGYESLIKSLENLNIKL